MYQCKWMIFWKLTHPSLCCCKICCKLPLRHFLKTAGNMQNEWFWYMKNNHWSLPFYTVLSGLVVQCIWLCLRGLQAGRKCVYFVEWVISINNTLYDHLTIAIQSCFYELVLDGHSGNFCWNGKSCHEKLLTCQLSLLHRWIHAF